MADDSAPIVGDGKRPHQGYDAAWRLDEQLPAVDTEEQLAVKEKVERPLTATVLPKSSVSSQIAEQQKQFEGLMTGPSALRLLGTARPVFPGWLTEQAEAFMSTMADEALAATFGFVDRRSIQLSYGCLSCK